MANHLAARARRSRHRVGAVTLLLIASLSSACAHGRTVGSYRPVGASAWYGNQTDDGVSLLLRVAPDAATARVRAALSAAGYSLTESRDARAKLRTAAHVVGSDTTIVVTAEITRVELSEPASSIVLTGTFDVASRGIRNAPVIQRPGEKNPLYERLRALAAAVAESRAPKP